MNGRFGRRPSARRWAAAALVSAALLGAAGQAPARPRPFATLVQFDGPPRAFTAQRGTISLAQATAIATSRFRGRVVRAETVARGDRIIHEIRILGDDGRVRTVRIDAQTGAFL